MTNDELIGKLHRACTQIRFAISVYETPAELPSGESTAERLEDAVKIIQDVRLYLDEVRAAEAWY